MLSHSLFCRRSKQSERQNYSEDGFFKQTEVMRLCVCAILTSSHVRHSKHETLFDLYSVPVYRSRVHSRLGHFYETTQIFPKNTKQHSRPARMTTTNVCISSLARRIVVGPFLCLCSKQMHSMFVALTIYRTPVHIVDNIYDGAKREQICMNGKKGI